MVSTAIPATAKSNGGIWFGLECMQLKWVAVAAPAIMTVILGRGLPGWIWMWLNAAALFFGAKWLTLSRMMSRPNGASPGRLLAYTILWPGMDVSRFCAASEVPRPKIREWNMAIAKSLIGAAIIWGGVRGAGAEHAWSAGWIGMIGIVLLVHFGIFHLISLGWRAFGIDARPIMRMPAAADSLSRFWGGRWNAAFSDLMRDQVFTPLRRRYGATAALGTVFLISGLLHELVISVPARSGYGLPSAYFVLQALGILLEHSKAGQWLGMGSGWKGWVFVLLVAGVPAIWLFHPAFVHNTVLPMLRAIGAI